MEQFTIARFLSTYSISSKTSSRSRGSFSVKVIMKVPSSRASSIILLIVSVSSSSVAVPGGYLESVWRVSSMETVSGMYFPSAIWISAKMRRLKTGPGMGGSQAEGITFSSVTRAGFSSSKREIIFFRIGPQAAFRGPLAVSFRVFPSCR